MQMNDITRAGSIRRFDAWGRRALAGALLVFLAIATVLLAAPARAENTLLHFLHQRAANVYPVDSILVTSATTSFDTSAAVLTDDLNPVSVAAIDTAHIATTQAMVPTNLWLVVEVVGTMQSLDSLYLITQYSQGPVPVGSTSATNGGSTNTFAGAQGSAYNWRWYAGVAAQSALANNTGSQTFVFPIRCTPANVNAWIVARYMRFILQGDTNAAAVGFSTRAWLVRRGGS